MTFARLAYYARSLFTLGVGVANPAHVVRALVRRPTSAAAPTVMRLRNGDAYAIRRPLDAWVIKEVVLDGEYAKVAPAIRPGWTVVDIGAAHGAFAITAARAGAARVVAVEPSPETFELLTDNLQRNAAQRVETYRSAVGASEGTASLALSPRGGVANSTAMKGGARLRIDVPMLSLAGLFERARVERCDFLKLDCEGAEFDILLSASDALLARVDRICLEYHDDLTEHTSGELVARLERAGFAVRRTPNPVAPAQGWLVALRDPGEARRVGGDDAAGDRAGLGGGVAWPLLRLARPHQWVKNLLLLVALLTAHQWSNATAAMHALLAVVAMCFASGAIYIVNDWCDIVADRAHPVKRLRPLASGRVSRHAALLFAAGLAVLAVALAWVLPRAFLAALALYWLGAIAYSFGLKRVRWLDVLLLSSLYVLRVVQGALAIDVPPSAWLIGFASLLFAALALRKRYAELDGAGRRGEPRIPGRSYTLAQRNAIAALGIALSIAAAAVLGAYATSVEAATYYARTLPLFGLAPVLLLWLGRGWSQAFRGASGEDPLVEALADPWSYLALAAMLALVTLAG